MNKSTLSSKLFIRIAPTIIATILLIGGLAFYSADKEINTVYDAQLISNANVLWTLISDEIKENDGDLDKPKKVDDIDLSKGNQLALNESADEYADSRMFRIWKSGRNVLYSDTALPNNIPNQNAGFSIVQYKDEMWRIYSLPIPNKPISIEVGEKMDLRETLVENILLNLALPLLLLVPVVGILIWFGIGSGLGTIRSLVAQIIIRSPDDLSHVNVETLPKDLLPLGKSLNQLFSKLEQSFTVEKRFTDHAAHQLRTPLATLKLQLQMLQQASSDEEKKTLINEVLQSSDRASKLVNMLLTASRLSHQPINLHQIAVYPVIASSMADLGLLARHKNIEMSLEGAEDASVLADEILLKLMINNLIENAIKYTPENGNIWVKIFPQIDSCKITITDTGCGIPEAERELVFERFYRVDTPKAEGSGLGLAIVSAIIKRFSGSIKLKTPDSGAGLMVEVILPTK